MNCERCEEVVLLALAGQQPDDLEAARAHMDECAACRTMATEFEATWKQLGTWTVPAAPVASGSLPWAGLRTRGFARQLWPVAAAAVVGLLAGLGLGRTGVTDDGRARFLLLLRRGPESINPDSGATFETMVAEYDAWRDQLTRRGVLVASSLLDASSGTALRADADSVIAETGPRTDADGDYVSGYYVISADDLAAAEAIARTSPHLRFGGSIEVRPVVAPPPPPAAEPGVVAVTVPAPSLAGNLLGDPAHRPALVYLPPSYDHDSDRRYPVLYLLHAFGVGPGSWRGDGGYEGMDIGATLDSLIAADAVDEMVVVMPDARTRYGGSWYASSAAIGDWESFVANDLTAFADSAFRTRPDRRARALAGQSMGGYGALRIGSARPDVFGTVIAISTPNIVNANPLGDAAIEAARAVTSPESVLAGSPLPAVIWSKAAAFSADSLAPFYAELPTSAETWSKWRAGTVVGLLAEPGRADGLRGGALFLGIGAEDPLRQETIALSDSLSAYGVVHDLVTFAGGHTIGVRAHLIESALPFASRQLAR